MQLMVNMLLGNKQNPNDLMRIVWVDGNTHCCYVVNIIEETFPILFDSEDIVQRLKQGELIVMEDDPWNQFIREEDLSEIEKNKRDFAWEVVQFIYHTPSIFIPQLRGDLIRNAVNEFAITSKTVRNYLKKYWSRGMVKNALLPDYKNCGKSRSGDRIYKKKAGRPRKYTSAILRSNVNDEWKNIFRKTLEKYYFIRTKPTLRYAYEQMLKEYFSVEDSNTKMKVLDLRYPIPSFDQFYYWYRKWYKSDYKVIKREGKREFLQNYRSILGSTVNDSMGIGMYAIDATVADIYLVSSIDRNKIIGRPIIYLVVDIFSRCIIGISVSIENMSGEMVRVALANTFDNKKNFCKRVLDMEISDEDWPLHYLPHTLLADRGSELISNELSVLVENLNIKIQNTAPYRAELKGVVESYFGILQQHISPFVPGVVRSDFQKRGAKDYRQQAVLNIKEYTKILVRCIIYYNKRLLKDYVLTKEMIEDQITPTPIEIFKWGLNKGNGQLRVMTFEQIQSNVMPSSEATVNSKGILFKGLYYSCLKAVQEQWFSYARINGSFKITIQYDPQDMSKIYIRYNRREYEVCHLVEHYGMYSHSTEEEVICLREGMKEKENKIEATELNNKIKLAQEIEDIVKEAKSETIHRSTINIKDIRKNRKEEQERQKEFSNQKASSVYEKDSKTIALFRKKQKEILDYEND